MKNWKKRLIPIVSVLVLGLGMVLYGIITNAAYKNIFDYADNNR